jgi:nitroreductase
LSLDDRDPGATLEQIEAALEKAHRAPLLLVAIACLGPRATDIPALERMVSLGAAVQNVLRGSHAMGFGSGLTSGQAMSSPHLRNLLSLREGESAVCCVNIGTVSKRKPASRVRPQPLEFLSVLGEAPATSRRLD